MPGVTEENIKHWLRMDIPKELLEALDASRKLGGSYIEDLLKKGIYRLEEMYGDQAELNLDSVIAEAIQSFTEKQRKTSENRSSLDDAKRTTETVDKQEVEVVVKHEVDGESFERRYLLDQASINQNRQYSKEYDENGRCADIVPVGKPYLVVTGVVVGGSNSPAKDLQVCADKIKDLQVYADKIADRLSLEVTWCGRTMATLEIDERTLVAGDKPVDELVAGFCDRAAREINIPNVSAKDIHRELSLAVGSRYEEIAAQSPVNESPASERSSES